LPQGNWQLMLNYSRIIGSGPAGGGGGGGGGGAPAEEEAKELFSLSPQYYTLFAEPGGLIQQDIVISNPKAETILVTPSLQQIDDESFNWASFKFPGATPQVSVAGGNAVKPGQSTLGLIIKVPKDIAFGQYKFNVKMVDNKGGKAIIFPVTVDVSQGINILGLLTRPIWQFEKPLGPIDGIYLWEIGLLIGGAYYIAGNKKLKRYLKK